MITIKPLNKIPSNQLYAAHEDAFSDYDFKWSRSDFEKMLNRRGYAPGLSFGAFDGDKLVAFTLNGVGSFNGVKTAYDTSTGTTKDYRKQGLATRIFNESLPTLKNERIEQYLLEVLQKNTGAVAVYSNIGFATTRELNCFKQDNEALHLRDESLPPNCSLRPIDLGRSAEMAAMWDFSPTWQNSFESIRRVPDDFKMIGAFIGGEFVGYGIIAPGAGDISQLAVHKSFRRQGIGSGILKELLRLNELSTIKVVNAEAGCDAIATFLENNGIPKLAMQYEMIKTLC